MHNMNLWPIHTIKVAFRSLGRAETTTLRLHTHERRIESERTNVRWYLREWDGTHRNCYYICTHVSPEILYAIKLTPTPPLTVALAKNIVLKILPGAKDCSRFPSVVNDLNVNVRLSGHRERDEKDDGELRVDANWPAATIGRVFVAVSRLASKVDFIQSDAQIVMTIDMGDRSKHYNKIDTVPD